MQRDHAPHVLNHGNGLRPLADLPEGARAVVVAIQGGKALARRMAVFGFTPGAQVEMLRNVGRGPVLVRLQRHRLALGRGEAEKVWVRPVAARPATAFLPPNK